LTTRIYLHAYLRATMDSNTPTNTEAELESFRRKWREEVTARTKPAERASTASSSKVPTSKSNASSAPIHSHVRRRSEEDFEDVSPQVYQDPGEKQHGRRLDESSAQSAAALAAGQEPNSALEHYESAVEKESAGRLGDSVALYRKAYKVGDLQMRRFKNLTTTARPPSRQNIQSEALPPIVFQDSSEEDTICPSSIFNHGNTASSNQDSRPQPIQCLNRRPKHQPVPSRFLHPPSIPHQRLLQPLHSRTISTYRSLPRPPQPHLHHSRRNPR
jgi:hypothetical protein